MCLIVETKHTIPVTLPFVIDVHKRNDDGFGMMWVEDNRVKTFKSVNLTPNEIYHKIKDVEHLNPYLHFRMRTHGDICEANSHPYYCGYGIYMMHNGVLSTETKSNERKSDTWHFVDQVIKPLFKRVKNPHDFIRDYIFTTVIEEFVGSNNRLVFADRGGYILINADSWYEIRNHHTKMAGIQVSNTYAWNESSFNPPIVQTHFPRHVHSTSYGNPTSGVGYSTFISDRAASELLEEFKEPYWLDKDWNVWEHKPVINGFSRRYDIRWDDLSAIVDKDEGESVIITPTTDPQMSLVLPAPAVVPGVVKTTSYNANTGRTVYVYTTTYPDGSISTSILDPIEDEVKDNEHVDPINTKLHPLDHEANSLISKEDEEEDEIAMGISAKAAEGCGLSETMYEEALVRQWLTYKDWEISTLVYSDPDEASIVLAKLLKVHHVTSDIPF